MKVDDGGGEEYEWGNASGGCGGSQILKVLKSLHKSFKIKIFH